MELLHYSFLCNQYVVGYQQTELGSSGEKRLLTPSFVNVTGEDYDLDNFQIVGVTKDKQADIQVMNTSGQWVGHYYWFREYYDKKTGITSPAGWYDIKGSTPAGVTLKPGAGFYLNVTANGLKAQSSGQVAGAITNELAVGKTLLGNGSPVELAIDKFEVVGATKDKQADIQLMNTSGQWVGHYYWFREYYDKKTGITSPAGWYDIKGSTPAGIALAPGQTVYVNTATANLKIVVPSAL